MKITNDVMFVSPGEDCVFCTPYNERRIKNFLLKCFAS